MVAAASAKDTAEGDDEEETVAPGKPMRIERLLANLGYGKRKECQMLVKQGVATRSDGSRLKIGEKVVWSDVLLDGEPLDPPPPITLLLHKPVGYVVTAPDDDNVPDPKIYDLLPQRFSIRRPFLSAVGRLDKDTSGLLLLTDDGQLVHRINSPKKGIWKVYEAQLSAPLEGKDAEAAVKKFASGQMLLTGDTIPLLPAKLTMLSPTQAQVAICEGRYHQVRRMFTQLGTEVVKLHRMKVGALTLEGLARGTWRYISAEELAAVFNGPSSSEVLGLPEGADAPARANSGQASPASAAKPTGPPSSSAASQAVARVSAVEDDGELQEEDEEGDEGQPGAPERSHDARLLQQLRAAARPKKLRDAARWRRRTQKLQGDLKKEEL